MPYLGYLYAVNWARGVVFDNPISNVLFQKKGNQIMNRSDLSHYILEGGVQYLKLFRGLAIGG
jgi:hypothetical protein